MTFSCLKLQFFICLYILFPLTIKVLQLSFQTVGFVLEIFSFFLPTLHICLAALELFFEMIYGGLENFVLLEDNLTVFVLLLGLLSTDFDLMLSFVEFDFELFKILLEMGIF